MAERQIAEMGGPEAAGVHLVGRDAIVAAHDRLGVAGADCEARGRAVQAGQRVTRAGVELARAGALVASRGGNG